MKEAIGGTWIFGIVMTFIVIFTTFVSVTTNWSRCYKVKDDIINIIQRNNGVTKHTVTQINATLKDLGYTTTSECPTDGDCWYGFTIGRDEHADNTNKEVNYCIKKVNINKMNSDGTWMGATGSIDRSYYHVVVFFRLNWPVFRMIFNFKVEGQTSQIILTRNDIDDMGNVENTSYCRSKR